MKTLPDTAIAPVVLSRRVLASAVLAAMLAASAPAGAQQQAAPAFPAETAAAC
ncbi:hypothetical protein AZ24_0024, partial [Bordetella bronchiseptica E013]